MPIQTNLAVTFAHCNEVIATKQATQQIAPKSRPPSNNKKEKSNQPAYPWHERVTTSPQKKGNTPTYSTQRNLQQATSGLYYKAMCRHLAVSKTWKSFTHQVLQSAIGNVSIRYSFSFPVIFFLSYLWCLFSFYVLEIQCDFRSDRLV